MRFAAIVQPARGARLFGKFMGRMMIRRSVVAVVAVLAFVLGCVVVSTPAGAVVDSAVIVPSPNVASDDALSSVSCVSASECVAVGYTDTGSAYETLAMV